VLDQRTRGPEGQGLKQSPPLHVYIQIYFQARKQQMNREAPGFH